MKARTMITGILLFAMLFSASALAEAYAGGQTGGALVTVSSLYYSDTEPVFYEDSLYALYHGCSQSEYIEALNALDEELGRAANCAEELDGVSIGSSAAIRCNAGTAVRLFGGLQMHDWNPGNPTIDRIWDRRGEVTLVASELYGWGRCEYGCVIYDEYYRFSVEGYSEQGKTTYDVICNVGSSYEGGEWCEATILSSSGVPWNDERSSDQYMIRADKYGPGTQNPTLSPYHENFPDSAPWDESAPWEDNTPVYAYPDTTSAVLTYLPIKAILQTCDFDGRYYYIRYNKYEGFVRVDQLDTDRPGKHMDYTTPLGMGTIVNCQQSVSLRPYPNAQYDALMQVPLGARVEVSDYNRDFYECVYGQTVGYILRDYVRVD